MIEVKKFDLGGIEVGGGELFFILGPCGLESEDFAWRMARELKLVADRVGIKFLFKASFDKANRTSVSSYRGPGVEEGTRILAEIGRELGVMVTTDIHSEKQAEIAGELIDLLQVPAFLCRQTDLLEACAKTGRAVNVKKGQFLAPWDVAPIIEKLEVFGCKKYFLTERGTTFGYNNLVADMRSLYWMREQGVPVIFDATHSVQRPGGLGGATGGDGKLAPVLAGAAVATGVDGVFMEVHENPAEALSDGPNQIPLNEIEGVLRRLVAIHHASSCRV